MFKELGYKIKAMGYVVYFLSLAALVVLGVFMILQGNLFGYVVGFSSFFIAWIPASLVYAFGEIYEKIMYDGKNVPIFKTKKQITEEKNAEDYEKIKHLQEVKNSQTVPDYDKLKKLKKLQEEQSKTKKIKVDDKFRETDI